MEMTKEKLTRIWEAYNDRIPIRDFEVFKSPDVSRKQYLTYMLNKKMEHQWYLDLMNKELDLIWHNYEGLYLVDYRSKDVYIVGDKPCDEYKEKEVCFAEVDDAGNFYFETQVIPMLETYYYDESTHSFRETAPTPSEVLIRTLSKCVILSEIIGIDFHDIPYEYNHLIIETLLNESIYINTDMKNYFLDIIFDQYKDKKIIRCENCNKYFIDINPPRLIDSKLCEDCSSSNVDEFDSSRVSKIDYYLNIAKTVSTRSTCLRRKFGAIIVNDDRIVSTGYAGAPQGRDNCCDRGECFRIKNNIQPGQRYELCRSVHAEMNAIINASKEEMKGSTLYLTGIENDGSITKNAEPCSMCKRVIINSGIKNVTVRTETGHKSFDVNDWIINDDSLNINHQGY